MRNILAFEKKTEMLWMPCKVRWGKALERTNPTPISISLRASHKRKKAAAWWHRIGGTPIIEQVDSPMPRFGEPASLNYLITEAPLSLV